MKIRFVFGVIPVPIFYTNSGMRVFAGKCFGFFIKIRPEYKNDEGLVQHELIHAKQFYCTAGLLGILRILKPIKYWTEIQAYRKQLEYSSDIVKDAIHFSKFLSTRYGLNISAERALKDLT
jgi:hypothetical protein